MRERGVVLAPLPYHTHTADVAARTELIVTDGIKLISPDKVYFTDVLRVFKENTFLYMHVVFGVLFSFSLLEVLLSCVCPSCHVMKEEEAEDVHWQVNMVQKKADNCIEKKYIYARVCSLTLRLL